MACLVGSCVKRNQLWKLGLIALVTAAIAQAQIQHLDEGQSRPAIVVGFVGGFVHRTDARHSEVQLIKKIQSIYGDGVRAEIFENRQRQQALRFILASLAGDGKGANEPRPDATIILFGHSWGASTAVYLARDLWQLGVPVTLLVQVDSIRKHGEDDAVIPPNVHQAINFYQDQGVLHGRRLITASDPSRTSILGNFRFHYETEPSECRAYPWYNRVLFKGHTAIECDPQVWSQVSELLRVRLSAPQPQDALLIHAHGLTVRATARQPNGD